MWEIAKWIVIVYVVGFLGTFILEASSGPVTPALCALRAAVWPLYWATGIPKGVRANPGDGYD